MQLHARWVAHLASGKTLRSLDNEGRSHSFAEVKALVAGGDRIRVIGWEPIPEDVAEKAQRYGEDVVTNAIEAQFLEVPATVKEVLPVQETRCVLNMGLTPMEARVAPYKFRDALIVALSQGKGEVLEYQIVFDDQPVTIIKPKD